MEVYSVGIIVPCFNQGHFAKDCIVSIKRQTYSNWHAVLLNDASTDSISWALCGNVANDKVSVVHIKDNLGRALIRNEGVKLLGAVDFILNVDCDDILTPTYVEQLVTALEANPAAGLAYGQLHYFGDNQNGKKWPTQHFNRAEIYVENNIPGPGMMIRSTALAKTSMWRRDFTSHGGEDYDLWLQIVESGWDTLWVQEAVYLYRQHRSSFLAGANQENQVEVALRILKHHRKGISNAVGIENFLNEKVMSHLFRSLRTGRFQQAWRFMSQIFDISPWIGTKLMLKYYLGRLVRRNALQSEEEGQPYL
jgi:glycosyltransferase involved in cell wall biosynthesis